MSEISAREGQWYLDRANHEFFLVIAIDESDGLIDVRDRYGDIDEFDLDEWDAMDLSVCSAPTEWWQDEEPGAEGSDGPSDGPEYGADGPEYGSGDATHHFKSSGTT